MAIGCCELCHHAYTDAGSRPKAKIAHQCVPYLSCSGSSSDAKRVAPSEPVPLTKAAIMVASGAEHSCAIDEDGAVWCWGKGSYGQLGVFRPEDSNGGPVEVQTMPGRAVVSDERRLVQTWPHATDVPEETCMCNVIFSSTAYQCQRLWHLHHS